MGRPKRDKSSAQVNWRDRSRWIGIVLLLVVGFGSAYGLWLRTWRMDIAREQDWYVVTSTLRMRDFRSRIEVFAQTPTAETLFALAASGARLEGATAQIPRRGPVAWRAEMVGLGDLIRTRLEASVRRHLTAPSQDHLASLAAAARELSPKLQAVEAALDRTVVRDGTRVQRANFGAGVIRELADALAAARAAAQALPH